MTLSSQIAALFSSLRTHAGNFPPHGTMSRVLKERYDLSKTRRTDHVPAGSDVLQLYATSSVEMWLRAVHSFLMSSALTTVSPIWASVAGYYASHYTIRAIAHLLGLFELHHDGQIVTLEESRSGFVCNFSKSRGLDKREHNFYWKRVKQYSLFITDSLFTDNSENDDIPSDVGHRSWVNYRDHVNEIPNFSPLKFEELKSRIEYIAKIELSAYPIPDRSKKFLNVEAVQIVAYHRIAYYREIVDGVLSNTNHFWSIHKNPSWCKDIIKFQRVKPRLIDMIGNE
jgi:hypothetical protein